MVSCGMVGFVRGWFVMAVRVWSVDTMMSFVMLWYLRFGCHGWLGFVMDG
jgi:hypothetical protein